MAYKLRKREVTGLGPHYFFGLAWSEVGTIVSIIVVLIGLFIWLSRVAITQPMAVSNRELKDAIDRLSKQIEGLGAKYDKLDQRIDAQDVVIGKHDEDIKTLFKRTDGGNYHGSK